MVYTFISINLNLKPIQKIILASWWIRIQSVYKSFISLRVLNYCFNLFIHTTNVQFFYFLFFVKGNTNTNVREVPYSPDEHRVR